MAPDFLIKCGPRDHLLPQITRGGGFGLGAAVIYAFLATSAYSLGSLPLVQNQKRRQSIYCMQKEGAMKELGP